jgi:hypothetical protein
MRRASWAVVAAALLLGLEGSARADAMSRAATSQGTTTARRVEWTVSGALFVSVNPTWWSVAASATRSFGEEVGDGRRWNLTFDVGANDAYSSPAITLEVALTPWFDLGLEYRGFGFYGKNGALLDFGRADAPYGDDEIDALLDTPAETSGYGQRIAMMEKLRHRIGSFVLAGQGAFALYNLAQHPGVYLDWETDKLVREVDGVFMLRAGAFWAPEIKWKGWEQWEVAIGPYWEFTAAGRTQLVRQRVGGALGVRIADAVSLAITAGVDAQDPNRQGQGFMVGTLAIDLPSF